MKGFWVNYELLYITYCLFRICYSADGDYVFAGGKSKYVCLYELRHRLLIKKFLITSNRSFDGIQEKLSGKHIKDGVNLNQIDEEQSDSDYESRKDNSLPGVKKPNYLKRNMKPRIE